MKKHILALAIAAGLTSFAGNAKAAIIVTTINEDMTKYIPFIYKISQNSVIRTGEGFYIGGFNAESQEGYYFMGGFSEDYDISDYDNYKFSLYTMSSSLLQLGSTIDGSTSFKEQYNYYNVGNPFTGKIYQGFRTQVYEKTYYNTYYGYIQGTGNGGTTWTLDSITFNSTPGASVTVTDTTAAVPEPSTYTLFGIGALALIIAYRRKVA
jgi:hypothetical protein